VEGMVRFRSGELFVKSSSLGSADCLSLKRRGLLNVIWRLAAQCAASIILRRVFGYSSS